MVFAPYVMTTMFGPGALNAVVFFICLGLFQIVSIGIIIKSSTPYLLALAILGNIGSIVIYFVSVSGVTIFGVPPQPLVAFGVLIKALETIFVACSAYLLASGLPSRELPGMTQEVEQQSIPISASKGADAAGDFSDRLED